MHTPLLDCDAAGYSESQRRKWEVVVQGGERERGRQRSRGEKEWQWDGWRRRKMEGWWNGKETRKEGVKKGEREGGRGGCWNLRLTRSEAAESQLQARRRWFTNQALSSPRTCTLSFSPPRLGYYYSGRDRPGTVCPCRWGDAASALSVGVYVCGCLSLTVSACWIYAYACWVSLMCVCLCV